MSLEEVGVLEFSAATTSARPRCSWLPPIKNRESWDDNPAAASGAPDLLCPRVSTGCRSTSRSADGSPVLLPFGRS
jgi:hypothetical protein